MSGKIIFAIFLLFLTTAYALDDDIIYDINEIKTNLQINSIVEIVNTDPSYSITFATANLSFVPIQEDTQDIISIKYNPEPKEKEEGYTFFQWDNPAIGKHDYKIEAEMLTRVDRKRVKQKAGFPIKYLPAEYEIYTEATDNMDSNDADIVAIASQLAEGEDDLYVVVNKLVSWIKENIEYSLDTLTAEVSQPASWVIRNRYGVCDEITSLFTAMARSLGIPVKFVSGVAYSNWNDLNDWGPHAWAEVYYPGVGWVSYDITYNEFGYVDATHIKLKESFDSNESSTSYEWKGRNVELDPEKLIVKTELIEKIGRAEQQIAIRVEPFKREVGFGSYDIIEAEIENLQDYYVSEDISLAKVKEMEIIGNLDKQIVLKPREKKKVFWLVKISDDLDKGFIYTLPISAYSSRNRTGKSLIGSNLKARIYNKEEMQTYIDEKTEEEQKSYSKDISLACEAKERIFLGDKLDINCELANEGNVYLKNLKVCLKERCETFDLGISKSWRISFDLDTDGAGEKDYTIKASSPDVSKTEHLTVMVFDKPNIEITNLEYADKINFGEALKLKFTLSKTSLSNPLNTQLMITRAKVTNKWDVGELKEDQEFAINFESVNMARENEFEIKIDYEDENGNRFETEKSISVEVVAEGFIDKLKMWLNKLKSYLG